MTIRATITSNRFRELAAQARQRLSDLVLDTAHAIEADARQRVPAKDNLLRSSITSTRTGELSAEVTVGAEHGAAVEFGGRTRDGASVPAQPYLTPAAEAARGPFEAAAGRLMS
jgi:hypothetical protein